MRDGALGYGLAIVALGAAALYAVSEIRDRQDDATKDLIDCMDKFSENGVPFPTDPGEISAAVAICNNDGSIVVTTE